MYFLLGKSVVLALLLLIHLAAAIAASGAWRVFDIPTRAWPPFMRSQLIFLLRLGPLAAALIFVFAFMVPAYLLHEPENSGEVVTFKLALLAVLSSAAVVVATVRVIGGQRATARLVRHWKQTGVQIEVPGFDVPVFKVDRAGPAAAVAGIFRPRIFVSEQVLDSLTGAELAAVLCHELGHIHSRDNLKRMVLRVCRDMLLVPIGTELDRRWAESAETAADEYVATLGKNKTLDLASALVKLARISPQAFPSHALSSPLMSEDRADVTHRVRRLLQLANSDHAPLALQRTYYDTFCRVALAAFAGLLALHLFDGRLLLTTHEAVEHFVWIFQ